MFVFIFSIIDLSDSMKLQMNGEHPCFLKNLHLINGLISRYHRIAAVTHDKSPQMKMAY